MSTLTNALFIIAITWFSMASSEDPVDNSTTTTTTLTTTSTSATTTTQVTTLIPPTGTPKTPADVPPTNHYVLTDKNDNNSCIVMNVGIRLTFNYVTKDGKKVKDFPVDVPEKPTVGGFCKGDQINDQRIELKFFKDFNLSLTMTMNTTAKKYFLSNVYFTFKYNNDQFPDVKPEVEADVNETVNFFQTAEDRNFVCVSSQNLFKRNNSIEHGLTSITTYSLSLQAFRNDTSDKFTGHTTHCPNDEVSQLVPIIVGACLAGLIVIVLIAYLIGRKRSRAGYESV